MVFADESPTAGVFCAVENGLQNGFVTLSTTSVDIDGHVCGQKNMCHQALRRYPPKEHCVKSRLETAKLALEGGTWAGLLFTPTRSGTAFWGTRFWGLWAFSTKNPTTTTNPNKQMATLDLRPYTRLLPHMHENYEVYSYIEWSVIPKNFLGMTDHSM